MSKFVFAFFFPFWTWILSIVKFDSPNAKNWFWYGCAFMGYVFIFNPVGGSQSDSVRYAQQLYQMHDQQTTFQSIVTSLLEEENKLDIFQSVVTLGVSFFTSDPHVLFLVFALIFGYFYSRNIWIVLSLSSEKPHTGYLWVVILIFLLVNPIWNINGVRMWIALHVFVYGVMGFFVENKKSKLIWSLASVLIHFSFLLPIYLLMLFFFLPKKKLSIYFVIFFVTSIYSQLDIQELKNIIIDFLPQKMVPKVEDYMSDEYVELRSHINSELSMYIGVQQKMLEFFKFISLIVIWIESKKNGLSVLQNQLLVMFLFFGSVINILDAIPSIGRFWSLNNMVFFSMLLVMLFDKNKLFEKLHSVTYYSAILLIFPILFSLRIGSDYFGVTLFWSNFISSTIYDDRIPIIVLVKSLI